MKKPKEWNKRDIKKARMNPPKDNPFLDVTDMALSNEYTGLISAPDTSKIQHESYSTMLDPDTVQDR